MNTGRLTLTFDEPVQERQLSATALTLRSSADAIASTYTLQGTSTVPGTTNSLVMELQLGQADLTAVTADKALFISNETSFLSYTSSLVQDMSNNQARFVSAVAVNKYTRDSQNPSLQSFSFLSMNAGQLRLSFNEPVDSATFNPRLITLQDSKAFPSFSLSLTGGTATNFVSTREEILVTLVEHDITQLKLLTGLATSQATSFVSLSSSVVSDIVGNPSNAILDSNAAQVVNFFPDSTPPTLTNWTINMNASTLSMTFDDVMDADSLTVTSITLQADGTNTDKINEFTLRGGSTASPDGYVIVVDITQSDLDEIKLRSGLATSLADSYLSLLSTAIDDQVPLGVTSIVPGRARQAAGYTPDTTQPDLSSFTLDMQNGRLSLTFSDVMNTSSLDVTQLTLQSNAAGSDAANTFSLTTSSSSSNNGYTIVIDLSTVDLNAIKARSGACYTALKHFHICPC